MSFKKLLDELETLSKSFGNDGDDNNGKAGGGDDDDAAIQAAAGGDVDGDGTPDGVDTDTAGDGDADGDDDAGATDGGGGDDDDGEDDATLGKSLQVTLENGETVDAVDGTALVKALIARVNRGDEALKKSISSTSRVLKGMSSLIKKQSAQILALSGQVEKIGASGSGKKSVTLAKALDTGAADERGMEPGAFMMKALEAQKAHRVTGSEVARMESYLNRGLAVPEDLVAKVLPAQAARA